MLRAIDQLDGYLGRPIADDVLSVALSGGAGDLAASKQTEVSERMRPALSRLAD